MDPAPTSRVALPEDARRLPPMGPEFDRALEDGLHELGLVGTRAASAASRRSYEWHARLLAAWGAAINLTAIREPVAVARRHVCDSLSAVSVLDGVGRGATAPGASAPRSLLDLGSGGGYPGLPLAAALPVVRVGLVDSVVKKARFLEVAARVVTEVLREDGLDAPGIETFAERAEDLAEDPDQRGSWDVVTVRAVGSLAESVELALPLLRIGGRLVAWRREAPPDALRGELRDAGSVMRACGGGRPRVVEVPLPDLAEHRLVVVPKERPTPPAYPRDPARRGRRR